VFKKDSDKKEKEEKKFSFERIHTSSSDDFDDRLFEIQDAPEMYSVKNINSMTFRTKFHNEE